MKINKRIRFWGLVILLVGVVFTYSFDEYYSVSRTFGITVKVKAQYINSKTENIPKANANIVSIQPVTGNIDVAIPANSFASDLSFTLATKAAFFAADRKTVKLSELGISITAIPALQPGKDLTVTIRYRDQDILGLDEDKLAIARYDESLRKWLVLRSTVYANENKVTALTNHISTFAIIQNVPAADLNAIKVYPNPWNPGLVPQGVVIDGLTKTAEIRIYTITGQLVNVLNSSDGNGRIIWNGKNSDGMNVSSGVYIAIVKNDSQKKVIRIGVERR